MLARKIFSLLKVVFLSFILFFTAVAPLRAAGAAEYIEAKKAPGMDLTKWTTGGPNFLGVLQIVGWGFIDESWGLSEPTNTEGQLNGAIPTLLGFMGSTYLQKPASVPQYLAYVQNKAGFPVKPAYAQFEGGFKAMEPILNIWILMRNIVYLFFVVVFVAIGFMIMFRKKLDPQTVISIQSALPMIVVSLILVTFSYAISGLIIDISELGTRVIASVFRGQYFPNINDLINKLTDPKTCTVLTAATLPDCTLNFFRVAGVLFQTGGITEAIQDAMQNIADGLGTGNGGSWVLRGTSGVVVPLVFTIAMIQTLIKGFFMLLTAYVNIVLSTIFSPFVFLANSFTPGSASQWFKGFLTNALVFPVTFLLLMLAALITSGTGTTSNVEGVQKAREAIYSIWQVPPSTDIKSFNWYPAPLGIFWRRVNPKDPSLGYEFDTDLINYLVAFGLLLAIPRVSDMIKSAFERRESGIGEGVSQTLLGAMRNIPIVGGLLSG